MRRIVESGLRWRTILLGTIGALLLLGGPLAAQSHAGTYTATECAFWNPYSEAAYSWNHAMLAVSRECGAGGQGLGAGAPANSPAPYGSEARFQLDAPIGTHFVSVSLFERGRDADGWYRNVVACGAFGCSPIEAPGDGAWHGNATIPGNYSSWFARLYCLNPAGCGGSPQAGVSVRDITMSILDDSVPTALQRGQLLSGELQRGTGRLDVTASDRGAGIASVWVLVNGQEIGRRSLTCRGTPMRPCPPDAGTLGFDLNTQASPFQDGDNTVQACASDYGDVPNIGCSATQTIRVDNSCIDSRVPGGTNLSALFARNRKDSLGVRAGRGALLTGRLTDSAGHPVSGASLCVREGVAGQGLADEGTVKTDTSGRYRYGVAPGPNRNLRIGYRFDRKELDRQARFFSRARPRLKLSRARTKNGRAVRLYGSIPGPSSNARVVILQAGYPHSSQWKTFAKARTGPHGDYDARYRFTSTFQTTTYRMRAVVPKQNGYPYTGGVSRARNVKVLGG